MSIFTPDEIEYLGSGLLGRLATVGPDGTPHIAPVGMISYNPHLDTMDIRGHDLTNTKKYRDIARYRACRPRRGRSRLHKAVAATGHRGPRECRGHREAGGRNLHTPGAHRGLGNRHRRVRAQQPIRRMKSQLQKWRGDPTLEISFTA